MLSRPVRAQIRAVDLRAPAPERRGPADQLAPMLAPVAESVDGAPQLDAPVLTELILQRPDRGGDLHRGEDRMPRACHGHIILPTDDTVHCRVGVESTHGCVRPAHPRPGTHGGGHSRVRERVELEFAPARRSLHLNDQTRIDALVVAAGDSGTEVIAVEVKYADRFNSRLVDISTTPYRGLAERAGLWADAAEVLGRRRVNQLARVHALAASYSLSLGVSAPASLVVLSHATDASAVDVVEEYRPLVNGPLVHHATLREACRSVVDAAPPRHGNAARDLDLRYGSEDGSAGIARSVVHGSGSVSSAAGPRPDSDRSPSPTR